MAGRSKMEVLVMLSELIRSYKGKRVLLTGHTGFKGSWMLLLLNYLGAEVHGYALEAEENDLYSLLNGDDLCHSTIADIRDVSTLSKVMKENQFDYIFHMAAQAIVLESYQDPSYTMETNIMGTVHLLDTLRSLDYKTRLVLLTTDKVYKNEEKQIAFKEEDSLGGKDPYSCSKSCVEMISKSFFRAYFANENPYGIKHDVFIARCGNVIGGGDRSSYRLTTDIVKGLESGTPISLRSPASTRPWLHVLDALTAYLLLGKSEFKEEDNTLPTFNFGPTEQEIYTVEELTQMMIKEWGTGQFQLAQPSDNQLESTYLRLDVQKAKDHLMWQAAYSTQDAVKATIDWYKHAKGRERAYSMDQIKAFFTS